MWKKGVLESRQMGGAFQMLRTYDLLWNPSLQTYVKGERTGVNDLMSWNADGTRMAYRMHTTTCTSCISTTISPRDVTSRSAKRSTSRRSSSRCSSSVRKRTT